MKAPPKKDIHGCPGCNPEEVIPLLEEHSVIVEEIPGGHYGNKYVVPCFMCGRAWVVANPSTPSRPAA